MEYWARFITQAHNTLTINILEKFFRGNFLKRVTT